jgi:hypothetical protein
MEIQERLSRERVKHIVSSYHLDGSETSSFQPYLDELLQAYPPPLIELALVETLVDGWSTVPLERGLKFLTQVHNRLKTWESQSVISTITPAQFQQISGLDPTPVFGSAELPPNRPIVRPS